MKGLSIAAPTPSPLSLLNNELTGRWVRDLTRFFKQAAEEVEEQARAKKIATKDEAEPEAQ